MSPTGWRFWSALFAAMILSYSAAADPCDSPQDPAAAIIDCTRSINSGIWKGRYLAACRANSPTVCPPLPLDKVVARASMSLLKDGSDPIAIAKPWRKALLRLWRRPRSDRGPVLFCAFF